MTVGKREGAVELQTANEKTSEKHEHCSTRGVSSSGRDILIVLGIVIGIYVSYIVYGYNQEHIYRLKIENTPENLTMFNQPSTGQQYEKFSYSFFLVFVCCLSNVLISFLILMQSHRGKINTALNPIKCRFVIKELMYISLSYTGSMLFTNYALTHVNYPTQVLVKSAKMVPILVGGFFFFKKSYPWHEYFAVFIITTALFAFNMAKESSGKQMENTLMGIVLLSLSLLCDGLTGPRQDRLISKHSNLSPVLLMFTTNIFAVVYTFIACLWFEGMAPLRFLYIHENALVYVIIFVVSGSVGQMFIYQSLIHFGSLYTSLFTTMRKAITTIFSVYIFGHRMNTTQWISVCAIFSTLMVHSVVKHQLKHRNKKHNTD